MYITKVISYNGAWKKLLNEHEEIFNELQDILEAFKIRLYDSRDWSENTSLVSQLISSSKEFEELLIHNQWVDTLEVTNQSQVRKYMGLFKNGIAVQFELSANSLSGFIFTKLKNLSPYQKNSNLPIIINLTENFLKKSIPNNKELYDGLVNVFEENLIEFEELLPISIKIPFLILGLDFEPHEIEIIEIIGQPEILTVERSIEFPTEYHQAGLGILNYFGTVLREKYSNQNAKVKIEQDGLTVRLVIESENGSKEVIEQALHEYELVVSGQANPNDFYDSPIKVLELKNQLRVFQFQIESQRDVIALQHGQIRDLKELAHAALSKPMPDIKIVNQISNTQNNIINLKKEIDQTYEQLDHLIYLSDSTDMKSRLRDLQNALDHIRHNDNPEDVKDSGAMKKLTKFLNEANETGNEVKSLAEKGGEARDLIKKLGRGYNSIAEWCGLPNIPIVFIKE